MFVCVCALAAGYLYSEEDWLTALETEESSMAGQSARVCVCVYVCLCVLIVCVMPLVSVSLCVQVCNSWSTSKPKEGGEWFAITVIQSLMPS